MLLLVRLGQPDAFLAEILLHGWVHGELFADGMPSNDPCELVAPADFGAVVGRVLDVLVVFVESGVVGADGFGDCFAHFSFDVLLVKEGWIPG